MKLHCHVMAQMEDVVVDQQLNFVIQIYLQRIQENVHVVCYHYNDHRLVCGWITTCSTLPVSNQG